jgi:anti-sigma factor RsiW
MCDSPGKLIAWLDHELPAEEAAEVERHLAGCSECRSNVDAYKRVSVEFDAYCDEAITSNDRRGMPRWAPVATAAGAAAALLVLFLILPRTRGKSPALQSPETTATVLPAAVAEVLSAPVRPVRRVHRRPLVGPAQNQDENSALAQHPNTYTLPEERVIQIAIPAEEMFPPGAVPEGMHFIADVTISADGSAERLSLRPRLAGFERRTTQP